MEAPKGTRGRDALVAVLKRMILDHEVEEMGGPRLCRWIQGPAIERLLDPAEDGGELSAVLAAEQPEVLPLGQERRSKVANQRMRRVDCHQRGSRPR